MISKILVTGSAGFIGSQLCEQLLTLSYKVVGMDCFSDNYSRKIKEKNLESLFDNSDFTFIEANIELSEDYKELNEDIDLVVHLAAKSGVRPSLDNPLAFYRTNVLGTLQLLEEMKKRQINKIIFASSSSVYGNNVKREALNEASSLLPISPYGLSKKQGEELIKLYHSAFGFSALCLRLFTVYGPRQRPDLAIHQFFKCIRDHQTISLFGNGKTARDYTFIKDILDGFINAIKHLDSEENKYDIINLGSNHPVSLIEMVKSIESSTKIKANIEYLAENKGDVNYTHADIAKAKSLLNYQPKYTFQEGIEAFNRWLNQDV